MKIFLPPLVLILLLSCNSSTEKPAQPKVNFDQKDSNLVMNHLTNPYSSIDISPMDMAYLPSDYPVQKMNGTASALPVARVIYSRPHRQGRKIFGDLLKYGEPWRLGANEATEIEVFEPITIQNKKVPRGRYILYCIPQENNWTIIFNSNLYSWGLKPDPAKDLYKFTIPVATTNTPLEYFTMVFEKTSAGANLIMAWENVIARLPIQF